MRWYWIVLIVYGSLWVIASPGIAACMLSSKITQEEEKRDGYESETGHDSKADSGI